MVLYEIKNGFAPRILTNINCTNENTSNCITCEIYTIMSYNICFGNICIVVRNQLLEENGMTVTNFPPPHFCGWMFNAYAVLSVVLKMQNTNCSIYHQNTYTSQQRKRHKDVYKYVFMLNHTNCLLSFTPMIA